MTAPKFYANELNDSKCEIEESGSSTYIVDLEGILYGLAQDPDTQAYTFENTGPFDQGATFSETEIEVVGEIDNYDEAKHK